MTTNPEDRTSSLVRKRSGAGEPLLLLHGVGESAAGWRPTQDALSPPSLVEDNRPTRPSEEIDTLPRLADREARAEPSQR